METNPGASPARAGSGTASSESARNSDAHTGRSAQSPNESEPLSVAVDQAVHSISILYRRLNNVLHRQTEKNPYMALGVAAGIGFVVGGGLASPLGQLIVRSSLRTLGPPLVQAVLNASAAAVEGVAAGKDDLSH